MADVTYSRVNWEDTPSTDTPINATNLNKMDAGISQVATRANESMPYANILDDWTDIGAVTTPNVYTADAMRVAELSESLKWKRVTQVAGTSIAVVPICNELSITVSCGFANGVLKSKFNLAYVEIPSSGAVYNYNSGYSGADTLAQRISVKRNLDETVNVQITNSTYNGTDYKANQSTALDVFYR